MSTSSIHSRQHFGYPEESSRWSKKCDLVAFLLVLASYIFIAPATIHIFLFFMLLFVCVLGLECIKKNRLKITGFLCWIILISSMYLFSCTYAVDQTFALKASRNFIAYLTCAYLFSLYANDKQTIQKIVLYFWFSGVFLASTLIASYLIYGPKHENEIRQGITFIEGICRDHSFGVNGGLNPNSAGIFCAISFACGIFLFLNKGEIKYLLFTFPIAGGIALSASRNSFASCLVASALLTFCHFRLGRQLKNLKFGIFTAVIVASIVVMTPQFSSFVYRTIGHRLTGESIAASASNIQRKQFLDSSITLFTEKPVFGHGIGSFQILAGNGQFTDSNYLELLVSFGLIGFTIYYSLYILILRNLLISITKEENLTILFFALIMTLAFSEIGLIVTGYPCVFLLLGTAYSHCKNSLNTANNRKNQTCRYNHNTELSTYKQHTLSYTKHPSVKLK